MSRRLRTTVLVLACAGIAAAPVAARAAGSDTGVKPRLGKPSTSFVVSFMAPQSAVQTGSTRFSYMVSANMSSHPSGCTSSSSSGVSQATGGSMVHVTLRPSGRWCRGLFRGQVQEFITPVCSGCPGPMVADIMCPLHAAVMPCPVTAGVMIAPQTIGTFSFRVHRAHRRHAHLH